MSKYIIGIDVSKKKLDAFCSYDSSKRSFDNNEDGIKELCTWLRPMEKPVMVYEPTAHHHRDLEARMIVKKIDIVRADPYRVRKFAEAKGQLAKTDSIDAEMIANAAIALQLPCTQIKEKELQQLQELCTQRRALIQQRTALSNMTKTLTMPELISNNNSLIEEITRQIAGAEQMMDALIKATPKINVQYKILCSIPGIGATTAATLLALMPELGEIDGKQAAALAGLAPYVRQSGSKVQRSAVRRGRHTVRHALYMAAVVASRYNKDIKACYDRLTEAGKPAKVALTACMRKLILMANALLRDQRMWGTGARYMLEPKLEKEVSHSASKEAVTLSA